MNKPRHFSLSPIYVDERRERLEAIEQQARQKLGLNAVPHVHGRQSAAYDPQYLRGAFRTAQRCRRVGAWLWAPLVLCALALILIICVLLFL